ncbi:MAG: sulfatase [Acidobacteriaceae bacterium]|nr:sulfatase [Acidobacteriaceae bacterium]
MAASRQAVGRQAQRRPNFVFILGEGLRPDELSYNGNKLIQTPALDRIGREGINFRNAFVVNALCLPSRASILTGLYSHTTGAVDNRNATIPSQFPIVSDLFHQGGYEVAFIGKSHVGGALRDHYWDYYFGFEGQSTYFETPIWEGVKGKYSEAKKYGEYIDDILTLKAVEWLRATHEKPFCLFLWLYAPHAPFYRPARLESALNGVPIPIPSTYGEFDEGYPRKARAVQQARNRIGSCYLTSDDPRSLEELAKDHLVGALSNDQDVGLVFRTLEEKGVLDDTAILLCSDHGFFLGEHHFYDKRLMYEPSIRVPLLIRYPKLIKAGIETSQMALNLDIPSTMLDMAGITIPSTMQGRSLTPFFKGGSVADWRKDWLYEYYEYPDYEHVEPHRGIRTDRYKLIDFYLEPEQFELYDLQTDPEEKNNLYGSPGQEQLGKKLRTRLEELRRETGDHYEYKIVPSQAPIAVCGTPSHFPEH